LPCSGMAAEDTFFVGHLSTPASHAARQLLTSRIWGQVGRRNLRAAVRCARKATHVRLSGCQAVWAAGGPEGRRAWGLWDWGGYIRYKMAYPEGKQASPQPKPS